MNIHNKKKISRKRVLITGAAGFIGGACVKEFLNRGWRVTALVHRRTSVQLDNWLREGRIHIVKASITDRRQLLRTLQKYIRETGEGFKVVVNCAGYASEVGRDSSFRTVNLHGVENLIECVCELPIGRLVQISTSDVYGVDDFESITEDAPLRNNRRNPYPKYKILSEQAIRSKLPPDKYVILRPAAVWGPGDTTLMPRIVRFLRSTPFIIHFGKRKGKNVWHLAYINNVTRMAYAAATTDEALGEVYNVADKERTSIDDYYRMLMSVFMPEKKVRSITLPYWLGEVLGLVSSTLSNLLNRKHPLFDPSMYGLHHVSHNIEFSHEKSEALLRCNGLNLVDHNNALRELKKYLTA